MNDNGDKLKPCPICGKDVKWKSGSIICSCGISFRPPSLPSFEKTNESWNLRVIQKSVVNINNNTAPITII